MIRAKHRYSLNSISARVRGCGTYVWLTWQYSTASAVFAVARSFFRKRYSRCLSAFDFTGLVDLRFRKGFLPFGLSDAFFAFLRSRYSWHLWAFDFLSFGLSDALAARLGFLHRLHSARDFAGRLWVAFVSCCTNRWNISSSVVCEENGVVSCCANRRNSSSSVACEDNVSFENCRNSAESIVRCAWVTYTAILLQETRRRF